MRRFVALLIGLVLATILAAPAPQMWPFPGPGTRALGGGGGGGITREYYGATSAGGSSKTGGGSDAFSDKTSVGFTGDGSDYLVLASWAGVGSTWNVNTEARLYDDTAAAVIAQTAYPQPDGPSYPGHQGIDIKTVSGSQTYSIEYRTTDTGYTAYIKQAALAVLKLTSNDKYVESPTRVTTSSTTFQNGATLTFTPESSGDYLIIASAVADMPANTVFVGLQLDINGTTQFGEPWKWETGTSNATQSWATMYRASFAASSQSIKIQYKNQGSAGTIGVSYQRIVALRLDGFHASHYADQTTPASTTSTSEQTFLTLAATAASGKNHLRMWCSTPGTNDQATSHVYAYLYQGTTEVLQGVFDSRHSFYATQHSACYWDVATGAGSTNWYVKYKSENGASVLMADSSIALLQLEP